jgi:hypothetical protein
VSVVDVLQPLVEITGSMLFAESSYPFLIDALIGSSALFSTIMPKVQNLAQIYARYKVHAARLHYQSMTAASTEGTISLSLTSGWRGGFSSLAEIAMCEHSYIGPVWASGSSPWWRSKENRWFFTDSLPSGDTYALDQVPFSVQIGRQANHGGSTAVVDTGLIWLELDIEFSDLKPPLQKSLSLKTDAIKLLTPATSNHIAWDRNNGMEGFWNWAADATAGFLLAGVPDLLDTGAGWFSDGGQVVELFADLPYGAYIPAPRGDTRDFVCISRSPEGEEKKTKTLPPGVMGRLGRSKGSLPKLRSRPTPRTEGRKIAGGQYTFSANSTSQGQPLSEALARAMSPNAAGDITLNLAFQPAVDGEDAVVVAAAVFNGTAATECNFQWSGLVETPGVFWLTNTFAEPTRHLFADASVEMSVVEQITTA